MDTVQSTYLFLCNDWGGGESTGAKAANGATNEDNLSVGTRCLLNPCYIMHTPSLHVQIGSDLQSHSNEGRNAGDTLSSGCKS